MGYDLYTSKELAHSAKGSGWANHKYIDKFMKNGKWHYVYKLTGNSRNEGNGGHTLRDYEEEFKKDKEYAQIEKDKKSGKYKQVNYTEYTRNGKSWLSSSYRIQNGNDVKIYKTKGKIAQAVEKSASKGKSFIEKLSKKKKK